MPALPRVVKTKKELGDLLAVLLNGLQSIEEEMTDGYIQLTFRSPTSIGIRDAASSEQSHMDQEESIDKDLADTSDKAFMELAAMLTKIRVLLSEGPQRVPQSSYNQICQLGISLMQELTLISEKPTNKFFFHSLTEIFKTFAKHFSECIKTNFIA